MTEQHPDISLSSVSGEDLQTQWQQALAARRQAANNNDPHRLLLANHEMLKVYAERTRRNPAIADELVAEATLEVVFRQQITPGVDVKTYRLYAYDQAAVFRVYQFNTEAARGFHMASSDGSFFGPKDPFQTEFDCLRWAQQFLILYLRWNLQQPQGVTKAPMPDVLRGVTPFGQTGTFLKDDQLAKMKDALEGLAHE